MLRNYYSLAKLGNKVSPAHFGHTAATWPMQAGDDKWETYKSRSRPYLTTFMN